MGEYIEGKIRRITFNLDDKTYEIFKQTCYEDGYSMQTAVQLLVKQYVDASKENQ